MLFPGVAFTDYSGGLFCVRIEPVSVTQ